jgi:diaminopimelate epimerase
MILDMEKKVHHRRYRLAIADPAGNITALIEAADDEPVPAALWTDEERRHIVQRVMREYPDVEQAGFVLPGRSGENGDGEDLRCSSSPSSLWRLEMAGGEFCGNAARSFGLFIAAQKTGLCGKSAVRITVSGAENPLAVLADTQNSTAEVALPPPRKVETVSCRGLSVPIVPASPAVPAIIFDGITHVIMEGIDRDTDEAALTETFVAVKHITEAALGPKPPAAFGVMFYDTERAFLRPAVFVNGTGTFVFENSCGSGSAAFAWYRALSFSDGAFCLDLRQPGGIISTKITKEKGKTLSLTIGGPVYFR